MKHKRIIALFLVFMMVFSLTGCWNSRELNTLGIAICMGIDKTENGYRVTEQILNPKAIAAKKVPNEPPVVTYEEEGKDMLEALRKMTVESPRKMYQSHLRMIIIGEDTAKDGLLDFIDFLTRDHEFRTDFYFAIAKGATANEVLNILTPLDIIPGINMYNTLKTSEAAWAPTKTIRITELINSINSEGKNTVITGVYIDQEADAPNTLDILKDIDIPKRLHFSNLGVFRKDKLVGWLDEEESKGYNHIIGNVRNSVGNIDIGNGEKVTFEIISEKTKVKAHLKDGKPAIDVNIKIASNIGAVSGDVDITKKETIEKIEKLFAEKVSIRSKMVSNAAQKDLKTDIFGFGEEVHRSYPKVWKKLKKDWNKEFENIPINITCEVKVKKLGQVTKSFFTKEKE